MLRYVEPNRPAMLRPASRTSIRTALRIVVALSLLPLLAPSTARAAAPIEGSFTVEGVERPFAHVAAFYVKGETGRDVLVVASDQVLQIAELKKFVAADPAAVKRPPDSQPYVAVRYNESGKPLKFDGWADTSSFFGTGDFFTGSAKFADGRIVCAAKYEDRSAKSPIRFEFSIDAPIGLDTVAVVKPVGPVVAKLTGTFTVEGKPVKFGFVSAWPDMFFKERTVRLIFSELDHTAYSDADWKVDAGKYGAMLVVHQFENSSNLSYRLVHASRENDGSSGAGGIRTTAFNVFDDRVEGRVFTKGEQDFYGTKWSCDLQITAAFSRPAQPATPPTTATGTTPIAPNTDARTAPPPRPNRRRLTR
jgi:hypothetical protein